MKKLIEIVALCPENFQTYERDFDTIKEAKAWAKECGLSAEYWQRLAETPDYHLREVWKLELRVNGECTQDFFPKWSKEKETQSLKIERALNGVIHSRNLYRDEKTGGTRRFIHAIADNGKVTVECTHSGERFQFVNDGSFRDAYLKPVLIEL